MKVYVLYDEEVRVKRAVATVLVSPCVRKHTRTSATQTSLRQREARPAAPRSSSLSENICSLQRRSDAVCADQEDRVYPVVCVRREGWSSPLVLNYAGHPPEPDAIRRHACARCGAWL